MLDLVKAFEMVKLELAWRSGLALHFHPRLLQPMLEYFVFVRILTRDGVVADGARTL